MGTALRVEVWAKSRDLALSATEDVFAAIDSIDGILSTWDPQSELNQTMARPWTSLAHPSPPLLELLDEALSWQTATGGRFSPTAGSLIQAWDLRGSGRRPGERQLAAAVRDAAPGAIEIDMTAGTLRRTRPDAAFDMGAFGKGAALRSAGVALARRRIEYAVLDFGGQLLQRSPVLSSPDPSGFQQRFPVAHPTYRDSVVGTIEVRNASVATSGNSERFATLQNDTLGHVLDPRTGRPTRAWGSATVVSSDPVEADVLSTALLVDGPQAGMSSSAPILLLVQTPRGLCARMNQPMRELAQLTPSILPCSTNPGPRSSRTFPKRNPR